MVTVTEAITTALGLSESGYVNPLSGSRTGDWAKPPGRAKRKRKQKIQKLSRRNNRT